MNPRWIVSLLVFLILLASLPLGPWNGPSATWLIEWAEAAESIASTTTAPQNVQDLLAQLQPRHGNPLPGYNWKA
ncbi:MAG: hypothetical protein SCG73_06045 [Nitrospiraceae bacterium]|nr:hypothetical protein [Nitrospiraceae bacterium]MDW7653825.1 hypothetical protein [Nitrospiraceae bacterium]